MNRNHRLLLGGLVAGAVAMVVLGAVSHYRSPATPHANDHRPAVSRVEPAAAVVFDGKQQPGQALRELEARISTDPRDTAALGMLARQLEAADAERAARYYRQVLVLDRSSATAWGGLARVYWAQENWDASEEAWRAVLRVTPGHPEAMFGLGAVAWKRGHLATARRWWIRVTQQVVAPDVAAQASAALQTIAGTLPSWNGELPPP